MNYFKALMALIIFVIFFIWAADFDVLRPLEMFFPVFHIIAGVSLAVVTVLHFLKTEFRVSEKVKNRAFIFMPASTFVICTVINYTFFQQMAHIQDSINYITIAQNLVKGQLHARMPEHYEFFRYLYMIPDGKNYYSLFLPGFSIFLMPFILLGIPFLANPLLTAFNVWISGKIAKRLFNDDIAFITMFFMFLSSFIVVMGGTAMGHPFCAAMTLGALYAYILSLDSDKWRYPVIAGAMIGWMALIRPQNSVFLAVPLAIHALFRITEKGTIKKGITLVASFLPFMILLLIYNWMYTGEFLLFKQDVYFNYSEPGNFCHRFGLGTGCPNSNWIDMPTEGVTWEYAFMVSYRRLAPLVVNLFLHPLTLLFAVFAFILAKGRDDLSKLTYLFILFSASFGGYFFFFFDGNVFGPRYLYEVSFFLIMLIAYGFNSVISFKFMRVPAFTLILAGLFFQLVYVYPELYKSYEKGFWDTDAKLRDAVKEAGLKNAVVFVSPIGLYGSGFTLMDNSDIENNDIIYARDLGYKQNRRLMFEYPGRDFYLASFKRPFHNTEPPVITKLERETDTGEIHIEMEDKSFPLEGVPDYCHVFPGRSFVNKYLEMEPPFKLMIQGQVFFFCRFRSMDEFYTFGQKINIPGRYRIVARGLGGPEMGRFKLYIDDRFAGILNFNVAEAGMGDAALEEIWLDAGFHMFRLEPDGLINRNNYFFLDYIDFIPLRR